jgi:hypothetical protein
MKSNGANTSNPTEATMSNKKPITKPITNWALARRDLLKGLGIGLGGLPLLKAGQARAQGKATGGLIVVLTSEGYRQGDWAPKPGPLAAQMLPWSCTPLEAVKNDLIFLPDLGNPFYGGPNVGGGHGSYGSIFWGGAPNGRVSYKQPQGKTLDQQVATSLPKLTHTSLAQAVQLDLTPKASPEAGSSRCFWAGKGQPINPIGDPYAVYNDVFAGIMVGTPGTPNMGAEDPEIKKLMNKRKSLLDYVGKNLDAYKARLGGEDKVAIEAHHTSVRDLERQLQSGGSAPAAMGCAPVKGTMLNMSDRLQYPNILKAQMGLAIQGIKCGVTRVSTLQLSDSSGNNINFAFVDGVPDNGTGYKSNFRNYHDVGHNPVFQGVDHKRIVDRWMMQQFAYMVTEMKSAGLLDSSLILWGNHMQDGSNHVAGKIPWILAGTAGGYFKTGQSMPAGGFSINNVMSDICLAFGVMPSFGEVKPGLKA